MAISLKDKKFGTLLLIVLVGILVGSYLNLLFGLIPGENNVVKNFFTYNFINFGFGFPHAVLVNLYAIKFKLGLQIKFSLLSILGIPLSLYFFRWFR